MLRKNLKDVTEAAREKAQSVAQAEALDFIDKIILPKLVREAESGYYLATVHVYTNIFVAEEIKKLLEKEDIFDYVTQQNNNFMDNFVFEISWD